MGRGPAAALWFAAISAMAGDPADEAARQWTIHTARMEGAAVNVREAADAVAAEAQRVADSGRIQAAARLASQVSDLNRRVVSASLAAEVLDEN